MMTITVIMKRGRERIKSRGKGRKERVVHNANSLTTQCPASPRATILPALANPPGIYIPGMTCPMVWNTSLASSGQLTCCVPSQFLVPLQPSLLTRPEELKSLTSKPKHSTALAPKKIIKSIPAETRAKLY